MPWTTGCTGAPGTGAAGAVEVAASARGGGGRWEGGAYFAGRAQQRVTVSVCDPAGNLNLSPVPVDSRSRPLPPDV